MRNSLRSPRRVQFLHFYPRSCGRAWSIPRGQTPSTQGPKRGYQHVNQRTSQRSRNPAKSEPANDARSVWREGRFGHFPGPGKCDLQRALPRLRLRGDLVARPCCPPKNPITRGETPRRTAEAPELPRRVARNVLARHDLRAGQAPGLPRHLPFRTTITEGTRQGCGGVKREAGALTLGRPGLVQS